MSFYSTDFPYRAAAMIDGTSANSNTIDATIAIPSTWALFWDNVQSDGDDIRITEADGVTVLAYDLDSWNYSNKSGNIRIDALTHSGQSANNAARVVRIYWGDSDASAGASANLTISSAKTGTVTLIDPSTGRFPIIRCQPPRLDVDETATVITKQSTEQTRVFWDLREMLAQRVESYQGSRLFEEVDFVTFTVADTNGGAQNGITDLTKLAIVDPYFVSTWIQGGTDDTNYLLTLTVYTTEGRVLDFRATLKVNDKAAHTSTV